MTDMLRGKEEAKRIADYIETLTKESRKALTLEFNQKYKGIAFGKAPQTLSQSLIDWFSRRDRNIKLTHATTSEEREGRVRMVFDGEVKKVLFKMNLDAIFTSSGLAESPSYIKELNVTVDRRDFSH